MLDLFLISSGGVAVKIKTKDGRLGYLLYDHGTDCLRLGKDYHIYYGMNITGNTPRWIHLVRDIATDWWKGWYYKQNSVFNGSILFGYGVFCGVNAALISAVRLPSLVKTAPGHLDFSRLSAVFRP